MEGLESSSPKGYNKKFIIGKWNELSGMKKKKIKNKLKWMEYSCWKSKIHNCDG